MSLHLLHCAPDPKALTLWATRHRLLSPDGDAGYAIHALLSAAFGGSAPKPFRYLGAQQGLLAYTDQSSESLREQAALVTPDVEQALRLDTLAMRAFPQTWRQDQLLGFEVRVRPVLRAKDGRERDVFLHAIESSTATGATTAADNREAVYADWLERQLSAQGAASVVSAGMEAFRLSRVIRRGAGKNSSERQARTVTGPDAVFKGVLQVRDDEAFNRLLRRGIGRHRAFGFGMLLLKPAGSC
ncbi:type I-E CRISPR-associated protein Cas6/Cse3/CasE [Halochromatium salexigens]|uniref:Type I-E CRISPR-associated protein Cas6/Cse3/CasE n=1 Tax=Halochromatium salexigens TaxID=49447 RepID=A0AAJ0UD23_HALSE|nr:type I-E CRISPR-associated protein Cas6/Cse3/CasE [Halochromatium salexigens]MBK5929269.1 type I-E CRISPR-associated protein Cas6/Cse3/CasE [Halochromatium salexigens]